MLQRRADVEDRAALFLKMRMGRPRDVEGALQVDVDHRAEPVRRELVGRADEVAGGAIDQDVEPAEGVDRASDDAVDVRRDANVTRRRDRAHPELPDLAFAVGSRCSALRLAIATSPASASASAIPRQSPSHRP